MTVSPLKVLIVDDEPLARKRIRTLAVEHRDVQVIGECSNGREAIASIQELSPDLVFLDVEMPEADGLRVVREVEGGSTPMFIFVTAHPKHGLAAFELDAVDYLLKPFDRSRFQVALGRARTRAASPAAVPTRPAPDHSNYLKQIAVRTGGAIIPLRVRDIDWIEADRNYVLLHVGETSYHKREAIGCIEHQLDPGAFRRVSRSVIVNLDRIAELRPCSSGDHKILLHGGQVLLLTQTYHKNLDEFMS
jgi:two-component system LytT family response regulator